MFGGGIDLSNGEEYLLEYGLLVRIFKTTGLAMIKAFNPFDNYGPRNPERQGFLHYIYQGNPVYRITESYLRLLSLILCIAVVLIPATIVLAEDLDTESLWTFVVEISGGDGTTQYVVSDPSHSVVDDSVAEITLDAGEEGCVAVWVVAHNDEFTNPKLYLLQINPQAGFPTVTAEFPAEGIGPETLDFTGNVEPPDPPGNYPWNQYASPIYDVFPSTYGTAIILDDKPNTWDLNPEDGSYDEQDLLDEADKIGNDDAYAVMDLNFTGSILGTYVLHIDSVATSGSGPEWNPWSHGASIIINIVPVLPFAAGLGSFGTMAGIFVLWKMRARRSM